MKKALWPALLLVAMAGAFVAGSWYNQQSTVTAATKATRKILYYVDPMHPAYKSNKPGIAPDCGMQLVAVYAEGGPPSADGPSASQSPGALTIGVDKQQLIGVQVGSAERVAGTRKLRIFGRVAPAETRVYSLNAGVDGYIREVSPVTTGSRVSRGQWLASFFSVDARAPVQAYLTSLDVLDRAARSGERPEQIRAGDVSAQLSVERLKAVGMSDIQIEEIRQTRQVPLMVRILAPATGFVVARNVTLGQKFEKGAEWFRIADLSRVWILADVFGSDAREVRPGAEAQVTLPDQHRSFRARVSEVLPEFDPATRSLKVRLEADNPGYALRPEMFVDVELAVEFPATVAVPVDAVIDSGERKTVFVERGQGVFEPREVLTGWRHDDRVEIVSGLVPGERIVTSGTFLLDSESRMKLAAAGISGRPSKDPTCGMDVDEGRARAAGLTTVSRGRTYFFCSLDCKNRFDGEPARRMARADRSSDDDAARFHTHPSPGLR